MILDYDLPYPIEPATKVCDACGGVILDDEDAADITCFGDVVHRYVHMRGCKTPCVTSAPGGPR